MEVSTRSTSARSVGKRLSAFAFGVLVLLIFCLGCSSDLTSSNYWKGMKDETAYVERKFRNTDAGLPLISGESPLEKPVEAFFSRRRERFRIGVVISGDYWEFFENLCGLVEGFSNIGWASKVNIPESFSHCDEVISWLATKKYSKYVEFAPEYFVDVNWGDNMAELRSKYLRSRPDVDVIVVYGGKAAKAFYDLNGYPIPVLSDAVTDCVGAGVTKSLEDSGKDFFSNKIDPNIYQQQLRLFHSLVGFKTLGIIYGDDPDGILYGAVNDVEAIAKERGFEIVRNTDVREYVSEETPILYLKALQDIVKKADAVYIGASTAVTEYNIMPQIVEILTQAKIPSFSLEGSIRVKDGILFSLSTSGSTVRSGIWMATKISHVLAGEKPRALDQRYDGAAALAVNVGTAKQIGFRLPLDLLVNSDEFYLDRSGRSALGGGGDAENARRTLLPKKRGDNRKFRVAVVQSGSYWEFTEHFKGIVEGLKASGWLKHSFDISKANSVSEIYALFRNGDYSDYIEFPEEYFIDMDWGAKSARAKTAFLEKRPDIDLIVGFGGVAGKFFSARAKFPIPVLLEGITDPVGSGIVYSVSDSGKDFITCRVDQTQYQRQIQLFHDFTGFKRLGIVYGDNEFGRLYSAVNDVELMALKMGFRISSNTNVKETVESDTAELYLKALRDVCSRSDAVYIGASTAVTECDIMPQIVEILKEARIPSFAQEGGIRVKDGVLMGVSSLETEKIGLYNADKIASILYGTVPRLLRQEFTGVPSIALNMDMAESIGLEVPLSTLATVDQLYGGKK